MNELLILPLIGFGVAGYCGYRWSKNKSWIALGVGGLFALLSVVGLVTPNISSLAMLVPVRARNGDHSESAPACQGKRIPARKIVGKNSGG